MRRGNSCARISTRIRREFLTLAEARKLLNKDPTWSNLLRGDLQMHTTWSDGSGTVAQMAEAGCNRDYEYVAITDHSKGLKIAGGIDEAELRKQAAEIAKANVLMSRDGGKLKVLSSIEMNLNPRGEGDMDPRSLSKLDLVLGSFHSILRVKEDQTERYLVGLKADWPRVFAEAAELDKALEIDCYPDRQDLNFTLLRIARKEGVRISLGTDAHHPWQLEFIELGLAAALQAKIPADRIVNFMSVLDLKRWVQKLRQGSARKQ